MKTTLIVVTAFAAIFNFQSASATTADLCSETYSQHATKTALVAKYIQAGGIVSGVGATVLGIAQSRFVMPAVAIGAAAPLVWVSGHFLARDARFGATLSAAILELDLPGNTLALGKIANYINEVVFSLKMVTRPAGDLPSQSLDSQLELLEKLKHAPMTTDRLAQAMRYLLDHDQLCPTNKPVLMPDEFIDAVATTVSNLGI